MRRAGRRRRLIELCDQLLHSGNGPRFAAQDDAVGARVCDDLNALRAFRRVAELFRRKLLQQFDDVADPRILQRNDRDFFVAGHVDLFDQLHEPHDVFGVVADDDDVGIRNCRDLTVLRDHRPQRFDEFVGVDVLRRDNPRDEFLAAAQRRIVERTAALFGERLLLDSYDARGFDRGKSVDAQDREEQLVDAVFIETRARNDGYLAFDARIDDEGFAGNRGDLRDQFVDVGIFEVDLPRLLLGERVASESEIPTPPRRRVAIGRTG